jgi:hypothetical protein
MEVHKFLTRWCFFAAGLTPSFIIAWYIMHVSGLLCQTDGSCNKRNVFSQLRQAGTY